MRSSNSPFNEKGFAELIRDVERHELLLTPGGDTNPGSGTNLGYTDSPTNSQTQDGGGRTVDQAIAAHVALANPHPQYQLLANAATAFTPLVGVWDKSTGTIAAAVSTQIAGWTARIPATLTGFNATTGDFVPPANGAYAFELWFTGTPVTPGTYVRLKLLGTYSKASALWPTTVYLGSNESYTLSTALYLTTAQTAQFYWDSGSNFTTSGFSLVITRVA